MCSSIKSLAIHVNPSKTSFQTVVAAKTSYLSILFRENRLETGQQIPETFPTLRAPVTVKEKRC